MNLHGMACALVGGALWGFSGTAVSYLFRSSGIDPMWVMSVRYGPRGHPVPAVFRCARRSPSL
ncbi:MAG: hypothetical protein ACLTSX_05690 [Collinsella sp.]